MPDGIPIDETRRALILAAVAAIEANPGGTAALPKEKITIRGLAETLPVYRLNTSDLVYNRVNGRIKSELAELRDALGRDLDDNSPDDQSKIRELLLRLRADENEKIETDIKNNGQMRPGIITADGIVINGNRRKAILEKVFEETGQERFKFLEVQILPIDITKSELWLIEAGIQLSAAQQLDYSPINHLLKLKEGLDAGLKIHEMQARIFGYDEDRLETDVARLELIDEYLDHYLGKSGRYYLVANLMEHFIDLQKIIAWSERPRGSPTIDWTFDDSSRAELKLVAFSYIRLKFPHMQIRVLRNIFAKHEAWEILRNSIDEVNKAQDENQTEREETGSSPIADDGEDDSEENPESGTTAALSEKERKDFQRERKWAEENRPALQEHFNESIEKIRILEQKNKPLSLARSALKYVEAIAEQRDENLGKLVDDELAKIIVVINEIRKTIKKQNR